jgi:PAS domain S-box-containing protein
VTASGGSDGWPERAAVAAALVTSSPLPVVALDLSNCVRLLNPAAEELTGRTQAEVLGRPLRELLPAETAEATLARIDAAARGEAGHLEIEIGHPERGRVAVGISFGPLAVDGQRIGAVGVGRDITRRKELERELADLASGFQALSEASDLGIYRLTFVPVPRFVDVNRAFEQGAGWSLEQLRADPDGFAATLPQEVAGRLVANRAEPRAAVWPVEFEWTMPDGSHAWLSVFEVDVRDDSGRLLSALGIVRDVTRRRRQEAALADALRLERAAASELRRVDDLRRLFLQAASHELRTPLTSVLGFASTLRDRRSELSERQVQTLTERVLAQARKLQRLLDDLLDVERLSRGVVELRRGRVDVAELVAGVVAEHGDRDVAVELEPAVAAVDARKFERILVNLLANARKHGGARADVVVRVRPGSPHPGVVGDPSPVWQGVRVEVEDDGPGIPDEQKRRVFGLFEQGSDDRSHAPGTGIGLTLVAELTRLHGGEVWIEDVEEGGTRVVVWLPDHSEGG